MNTQGKVPLPAPGFFLGELLFSWSRRVLGRRTGQGLLLAASLLSDSEPEQWVESFEGPQEAPLILAPSLSQN